MKIKFFYLVNQYGTRRSCILTERLSAQALRDDSSSNFPGESFRIIETDNFETIPREWIEDGEQYPTYYFVVEETGLRFSFESVPNFDSAQLLLGEYMLRFPDRRLQLASTANLEEIPATFAFYQFKEPTK